MDSMKKLYALLAILIVIYVGVNFAYNGLDTMNSLSHVNLNVGLSMNSGNDGDGIVIGTSIFDRIDNFEDKKINENEVNLHDSSKNLTITVTELDQNQNIKDTVIGLLNGDSTITSNQTVIQNQVSAYFLYEENVDNYNAKIYFNKDNKNYLISGNGISYDDSDYFINACKDIINSMRANGNVNYSRY